MKDDRLIFYAICSSIFPFFHIAIGDKRRAIGTKPVAPKEPKQPEAFGPPIMSVPLAANLTKDQSTQPPESNVTDKDVSVSGNIVCLGKEYSRNGEYTTLIEKGLGVIESELSRLKDPQK